MLTIFGLLDNNMFFWVSSLISLLYNIYSRFKNVHGIKLLIDDRKRNLIEAKRVGFFYKTKFVLYTILTLLSVSFLVLNCFGEISLVNIKIVNRY